MRETKNPPPFPSLSLSLSFFLFLFLFLPLSLLLPLSFSPPTFPLSAPPQISPSPHTFSLVELNPDSTCLALRLGGSAIKERGMYLPVASCRQQRFHSFLTVLTDLPEVAVWELEDQGAAIDGMLSEFRALGHAKGYAVY